MSDGLEPCVVIYVPVEWPVVVHVFAGVDRDERRVLLDLERRADLFGEIEDAVRALLDRLHAEYGEAA